MASKELQELISPDSSPLSNQLTLCTELPCVKESGVICPCDCIWSRSSPMLLAAFRPSSISPCSRMSRDLSALYAQTPEKQSACSSSMTESLFASTWLALACCWALWTCSIMLSWFCTWCPTSCAMTYA
jgi:hypothetical protein